MNAKVHLVNFDSRREGVTVARALKTSERQLDDAIVSLLHLGQTSVEGRLTANFAAAVGHEALVEISQAFTAAVATRGALIRAHGHLLTVAEEHAVSWRLEGPLETKPTTGALTRADEVG